MTVPAIQKVCRLCAQNCASRPRVKDQLGRYFCRSCYDLAIARKRAKENRTAASSSAAAMATPPAAPTIAATSRPPPPPVPAVTPPASPLALPHAPSAALPPALPRTGRAALPPSPSPIIVPVVQPVANPIGPERQLMAEPAALQTPPPEPPLPRDAPPMAEPIAPPIEWHRADALRHAVDSILDDGDDALAGEIDDAQPVPRATEQPVERTETPAREPSSFELEPERIEYVFDDVSATVAPIELPAPLTPVEAVDSLAADAFDDRGDLADSLAATSEPWPAAAPLEPARDGSPSESLPPGDANGLVIPRVRSARSMLLLDDEPPPVAFAACAHCRRPLPTGAIVCLACGFNVLSGEMSNEDTDRPPPRPRPHTGWAGPALVGIGLLLVALAAGYLLFGTRVGLVAFAAAAFVAVPAWFIWAMADARNTEGAQLKILVVPGYVFAWVFGGSRSRYLRAMSIVVVAIAVLAAAMFYQRRQIAREHSRAVLDQRARASMPG